MSRRTGGSRMPGRDGVPGGDSPAARLGAAFLCGILLMLAGALPAAAQAGWWQKYRQAREILEAGGDGALAESLLRQAIEEKPEASGNLLRRYTPYYYLGVILAERGDCRQAISVFGQSERQGALKDDQGTDLARRRSQCQKRVDEVRDARARTEQALAEARDRLAAVDRLSQRPDLAETWAAGSPSFAERRRRHAESLIPLGGRMEAADTSLDVAALEGVAEAARGATGQLRSLEQAARERLAELNAALAASVTALEEQEQEATRLLRAAAGIEPYPSALGRRIANVRQLLERVEAERESAGSQELDALTEELRQENRRLSFQVAGPPRTLVRAAESYLANDFLAALEALEGYAPRNDRTRFFSFLLEGAALHGLVMEMGGDAPDEQGRLEAAVRAAAAFDPSPGIPAEAYFPPAFRALYETAVAERIAAEARATAAAAETEGDSGEGGGAE